MKKIIKVVVAFALLGLSSCSGFLDLKPQNQIIPTSAEDYSAMLNTYLEEIEYGRKGYIVPSFYEAYDMDTAMDDLDILAKPGDIVGVYLGTLINENSSVYYMGIYTRISAMNMILEGLKDDTSELAVKTKAACYAIRALCHFNLLRMFCDPVVAGVYPQLGISCVEEFDMEAKPLRNTYAESVEFIESDFKKALEMNLQDKTYMFTTDVVEAFMARFYFWIGDWDNALALARKVLAKYPLISGQEYLDMFAGLEQKGNMILKAKIYSNSSLDSAEAAMCELMRSRPVNRTLVELFDELDKDVRYQLSMNELRETEKTPIGCIRGAEMAFIIAECLYHKGDTQGALEMINTIRRHRISDYTDLTMDELPQVDVSALIKMDANGKSLTPLISLILNERRKEFFMEGDRLFERKRNGRPENWVASFGRVYTNYKYMYTFPIPYRETLIIEGLQQNPGYEEVTNS